MSRLPLLLVAVCLCCGCQEAADNGSAQKVAETSPSTETQEKAPSTAPVAAVEERSTAVVGGTEAGAAARTAIEALGGRFSGNNTELRLVGTNIDDADVEHLKGLTRLKMLFFGDTQISDAGLQHISELAGLEGLMLDNTPISDAGLMHVSGLSRLEWLDLSNTQISDAGLKHLKRLTGLKGIRLGGSQVTDAGLEHIAGFGSLERLELSDTRISDAGLKQIAELNSMKWLELNNTQVTGAGLEHISGLTNLEVLKLNNTKVSDAGLEHIAGLVNLVQLDLSNTQIGDAGLEHIAGFSSLKRLNLSHTQLTGAGLKHLRALTNLSSLNLNDTRIGDGGLEHLQELTSLTFIDLSTTQISDAGLEQLKSFASLESLNLRNTQVSDAGLLHLKALTSPRFDIDLRGTRTTDKGRRELQAAFPTCKVRPRVVSPEEPAAVARESHVRTTTKNGPSRSLSGRVLFDGEAPTINPLFKKGAAVKEAEICSAADMPDESLLIGPDGGIANVFIYLNKAPSGLAKEPLSKESTLIHMQSCRFLPHSMIVRTNQIVKMRNDDRANHNLHTYPHRNASVNQLVPPYQEESLQLVYKNAEREPVKVTCDFHTWMTAWHLPLDHPFAAVTDESGNFTIDGLPVGEHKFIVWHERATGHLLERKLLVEITPVQATHVELKYAGERFGIQTAAVEEFRSDDASSIDEDSTVIDASSTDLSPPDSLIESATDATSLVARQDATFYTSDGTPYSGWVKSYGDSRKSQIVMLGEYKDGKLHGKSWTWHKNGTLESIEHHKDHEAHGSHTMWYDNGRKAHDVTYHDGKMEGPATFWHQNGQMRQKSTFKGGKNHGLVTGWHENGQLRMEATYKAGKVEDGPFILWHKNGEKASEGTFKAGKAVGLHVKWYEDGTKQSEATFRDGEMVGNGTRWDGDGNKHSE